jgi:signal transduction histidine kinase/uncharacterized membrane protein YqjE
MHRTTEHMSAWVRVHLAAPVFEDEDKTRTARLLNVALMIIFAAFLVVIPILVIIDPAHRMVNLSFAVMWLGAIVGTWYLVHRGLVQTASIILVSLALVSATFSTYWFGGVSSSSVATYFLVIALAGLLLGQRGGLAFGALSGLITLGIFYLEHSGLQDYSQDTGAFGDWIILITCFSLLILLLNHALRSINEGFGRARQNARALAESYRNLARRARYLKATSEIASEATAVLDLEELLTRVVTLISERFDFCHTDVFLLDQTGEWAVLRAASSEIRQRMIAQGHRLLVEEKSSIGYTISQGKPLILSNVKGERVHEGSESSEPRSVLALPLRTKEETIGALGAQSTDPHAFSQEDVEVLQTLADQIAVGIENARLYEAVQRELAERERAEEALGQSVSLLQATLESTVDGILVVDMEGQIVNFNQRFVEMWHIPDYIIASRDDHRALEFILTQLSDPDELVHRVRQLRDQPDSESLGLLHFRDGRIFEHYSRPQRIGDRVIGRVLNFRDVTGQMQVEEQLQRYAWDLEQTNEEVKQFTYTLSHHLRAPLVNLKGFTAELHAATDAIRPAIQAALPHLDESQQQAITQTLQEGIPDALGFIDASTTRIDQLSNAVLRLSHLSRRKLKPEPVDMHALVQATLEKLADQIEEHQGQVTVGPLPEVVADRASMEQIVENILGNAVKYLHPDRPLEIEITAEYNDDEALISVRDNGRGIAEEDMDKVFAPFRRAGLQDVPGEGMGLAYAQTLARRHGGRIWYESQPGVGTTFTFAIPNHLEGVCYV